MARLVSLLVGGAAAVLVLYPIFFLLQASLSVGDPQARPPEAYGLDNFADLRTTYRGHIQRMLELAGVQDPAASADQIFALET